MKKTASPPRADTMDEVIALEKEIVELLPVVKAKIENGKKGQRFDMTFIFEGEAVLAGKPSMLPGTRLDRLRQIAGELRKNSTENRS